MPGVIPPHEDKLETLLKLYQSLAEAEEDVAAKEAQLRTAKEKHDDLATRLLPAVMADLGLAEVRMADGRTLSIQSKYFGSVAQTRMNQAVAWLEARNMDGIVDREIIIKDWDHNQLATLNAAEIDYNIKQSIHPSKLRAFVRERLEANDPDFPKELFAASVVNHAVIKESA